MQGKADATWVFMGWEGVLARAQGVELVPLSLDEYKVRCVVILFDLNSLVVARMFSRPASCLFD